MLHCRKRAKKKTGCSLGRLVVSAIDSFLFSWNEDYVRGIILIILQKETTRTWKVEHINLPGFQERLQKIPDKLKIEVFKHRTK